jgi:flagellar assembly protein FliH
MSETPALPRFNFDTVFDAGGEVAFQAPRRKRLYSGDEVDVVRREAQAEGERIAYASIASRQADAMAEIAAACALALPRLAEVAHEHRIGASELALACGKSIAAAALERFPVAPLTAAIEALAQEISATPRLVVTAEAELAERLQAALEEGQTGGYAGAFVIKTDPGMTRHAFILDFGDGQAAFDPAAAAERVSQTLEAALAAEGLHAEPLIPGSES